MYQSELFKNHSDIKNDKKSFRSNQFPNNRAIKERELSLRKQIFEKLLQPNSQATSLMQSKNVQLN